MIASRRAWHFRIWLALVPFLLTLVALAIILREPAGSIGGPP
jgi:hypothetical protein